MKTTINLKMMMEKNACDEAQDLIATAFGHETITLIEALDATGIQEAFWWFGANDLTPDQERDLCLLACDYAEHTLHIFEDKYPDDSRPRHAIETARLYAVGQATKEDIEKARSAAYAAYTAGDAAYTAGDAAAAERKYQTEKLRELLTEWCAS